MSDEHTAWRRIDDELAGSLLEQVIGWLIAGAAIAWWLGRESRQRA